MCVKFSYERWISPRDLIYNPVPRKNNNVYLNIYVKRVDLMLKILTKNKNKNKTKKGKKPQSTNAHILTLKMLVFSSYRWCDVVLMMTK